ncbi:MAG TPA: hypothetical protein VGG73_08375 [Vicinamibacterales bacterium]|jgi:hypothetical protein
MMVRVTVLALMLTALVGAQAVVDKRLTSEDVAKVVGITGIRSVARGAQTGAGGDLNFSRPDGKLLLMVNFGDAKLYTKARQQKQTTVGGKAYPMELFAHRVTGVGEEAFASPPGSVQYVIYARKGNNAISVTSFYSSAGEAIRPLLNEAQLKSIAQTIFSRW